MPAPDAGPTPAPAPEALHADLAAKLHLVFARHPVNPDALLVDVMTVLAEGGWIKDGVPPAVQVLADARSIYDEAVLAKLVVRFFRTMILGGLVVAETPQAMDWLKDYIDGAVRGHGPLGKPMIWPDRLPAISSLLRSFGFQPTPTNPPYVSPRPGGALLAAALPDPETPDVRSIVPLADAEETALGLILDSLTAGVSVGAVPRSVALRAMARAAAAERAEVYDLVGDLAKAVDELKDLYGSGPVESGTGYRDASALYHRVEALLEDGPLVRPAPIAALRQLRDHQQQADEGGERVTVSRQALDEALAYFDGRAGEVS